MQAALRTALSVAIVVASLALAGCARWCKPEIVRVPVEVERVRIVVEPVPAELLRQHPVATGDLAHCPQVAAQRRAELDACNADKQAIKDRQHGRQE